MDDRKQCPMCAELISTQALICPHCRTEFVDAEAERRETLRWVAIGLTMLVGLAAFGWLYWYVAYHP